MIQQVPKLVHMAHILRFPSGFCCPVKRHCAKLVLRSTVADGFRWVRLLTPERTWGQTLPVSDLDAGLEKCRPHGEKVVHLRHLAQPFSTLGKGSDCRLGNCEINWAWPLLAAAVRSL